ncbi:MAG: hypothetical protein JWO59_2557 [Chloroflexi bacterium]|nr:hypothetical protein [Chloroflexota bacterium]
MEMTPNNEFMRFHRLFIFMVIALVFGILMAVFKGNGDGIRMAIGNAIAPWLILPFVATAMTKSRFPQSVLVGLGVSLVGLIGFYLANTFVLDLGPHPWLVDFGLTMSAGRIYFVLAFLSGPIFGVLGGYLHQKKSNTILVFIASLFVLEPCIGLLCHRFSPGFTSYVDYPFIWLAEVIIGVIMFIVIVVRLQPIRRR